MSATQRKCETCRFVDGEFCTHRSTGDCDHTYSLWEEKGSADTQAAPGGANAPAAIPAQPAPVANGNPAAWDLVMSDMRARDALGLRRYGVRLQPGNGRDTLRDAYEEALDLAVYLRAAIYERDGK